MNGLERTLKFLEGEAVDYPPFHPIVMRWAAKYAGVKYRDFCLDPGAKVGAMLRCSEDFHADWVTVMSDPWAEAEAFGVEVEYPEDNLPYDTSGHISSVEEAAQLLPFDPEKHHRTANRIEEVRQFHELAEDRLFIVGWVEGPVAEFADLRGTSEAAMDLIDEPEACASAMDVFVASAKAFLIKQIEAGAHCVGIGDAFCSQIGPKLYREFAWGREKELVDCIHAHGAKAKLHICGNTSPILPDMIATGADIIDVDHLVPDMGAFRELLGPGQVFSGKCDPVSVIQNGTPVQISACVEESFRQAGGRAIVSAGCEIPPDTSVGNLRAFESARRSRP